MLRNIEGVPSSRTAIAARKKSPNKMYVSKAGVKDFGNKIRIDAYMYDEGQAQAEAMAKRMEAKEGRNKGGAGGRGRAPGGRGGAPQ